jgi:DNA polymerase II large subunit
MFAHVSLLEILDVMSLRCQSIGKKVETHVKEIEVEGTDTVHFLSQQPPHIRHNTSPKYKKHKQGEDASTHLQADKTHTTSIQDQEHTFHFNDLAF